MFGQIVHRMRSGATRCEVLLVAAMLATLALIALPGLTETTERARKARCLSNLRNLAAAAQAYANEDSRELLVPIHQSHTSTLHTQGWTGTFVGTDGMAYPAGSGAVRFGMPYSFGGRTATVPFGSTQVMTNPNGFWGARTRPLNRYVLGSASDPSVEATQSFECPADTGYPDTRYTRDVPRQVVNIPCFNLGGNSYRFSACGYYWVGSNSGSGGTFSVAAWGHARSALSQPDRLILFSDGTFDGLTRVLGSINGTPIPRGWHGELYADQVALADGSARLTSAVQFIGPWDSATLQEMNMATDVPWYYYLRKGDEWTIDAFPAPGVRIVMRRPDGTVVTPNVPAAQLSHWPYQNYTNLD
jgi:type II secretory pathway pseudopilin PulG